MADTVTAEYLYNGHKRKILQLTNISDGTGETAVVKADLSTLTFYLGMVPTYTTVDMIDYDIGGMDSVRLYWDHTADDVIAILPPGQGTIYWNALGGKTDPRSPGGTGNIILTTNGQEAGGTYNITLYFRCKA